MLSETQIQDLRSRQRGPLITPNDANYDEARKIYNGMIDKRPALIAQCSDVADVIQAVNFGREQKLDIAIRSGGHHGAGLSLVDNGLVIDLSPMKGIRTDPQAKTVLVQSGCTWGDVDHATHAFGLAVPSGMISTTGVSGLTLGGGVGHLTRKFGLTIDNLLSADMVLANGNFITANANQNKDLFWAIPRLCRECRLRDRNASGGARQTWPDAGSSAHVPRRVRSGTFRPPRIRPGPGRFTSDLSTIAGPQGGAGASRTASGCWTCQGAEN